MGLPKLQELRDAMESGELDGLALVRALTADGSFVRRLEALGKQASPASRPRLNCQALVAAAAAADNSDQRQTIRDLLNAALDNGLLDTTHLLSKAAVFQAMGRSAETGAILEETGLLAVLLRECADRLPTRATEHLFQHITILLTNVAVQPRVAERLSQKQRDDMERLKVKEQEVVERLGQGDEAKPKAKTKSRREWEMERCESSEPPEDFRSLPIIPAREDVLVFAQPYLRRNRILGAYDSADHYLDVQFRLLREDYIHDLRLGVQHYSPDPQLPGGHRGNADLRVYKGARVGSAKVDKAGLMVSTVSFDVAPFARLNWTSSKRLIYGSLLLFSSDNFKSDLAFGVVQNRDATELSRGRIDVMMENPGLVRKDVEYVMAETSAYFEAYRYVLEGIKRLRQHNLPFPQHIVHADPNVLPPDYLRGLGGGHFDGDFAGFGAEPPRVDFGPLLREGLAGSCRPDQRRRWPAKEDFGSRGYDSSQRDALHHALNHRIAIIQGPPGTGKTFIGLEIMKLLLHPPNALLWNPNAAQMPGDRYKRGPRVNKGAPILVVCYTNHALDQFLEGVLSFNPDLQPGELIRIGGRSKVDALQPYSLFNARQHTNTPGDVWHRLKERRSEMFAAKGALLRSSALLQLLDGDVPTFRPGFRFASALPDPNRVLDDPFAAGLQKVLGELASNAGSAEGEEGLARWLLGLDDLRSATRPTRLAARLSQASGRSEDACLLALRRAQDAQMNILDAENNDHLVRYAMLWLGRNPTVDRDQRSPLDPASLKIHQVVAEMPGVGTYHATLALSLNDWDKERAKHWLRQPVQERVAAEDAEAAAADEVDADESRALDIGDKTAAFADELKAHLKNMAHGFLNAEEVMRLERALQMSDGFEPARETKKRNLELLKAQILATPPMPRDQMARLQPETVEDLAIPQRWAYVNGVRRFLLELNSEAVQKVETAYSEAARAHKEVQLLQDAEVMKAAQVIGMTTTGAARYQSVLSDIRPPIVVLEEAAEVFEAHLLTSLSAGTQHLIMIGDHKQLRPSPAVHHLAQAYHLDVSLFERLINNGLPHVRLSQQHRMRPAIARTLMPHFYQDLRDHKDVFNCPAIEGVSSSLFFWEHSGLESGDDGGDKSKKNVEEARMVVGLALYLRQQGYEPDRITILAAYVGQLLTLKGLTQANPLLKHIPVKVVDNYQGEENDIIILSLVRSNKNNSIGFLKTDNRVCVALSRAKHGLFVVGNIEFLARNCKTWADIRQSLVDYEAAEGEANPTPKIGRAFPIFCPRHQELQLVTRASEFKTKSHEGGCAKDCNTLMDCGHACTKQCHAFDRDHAKAFCDKPCTRPCARGLHPCKARCAQKCPDCTSQHRHTMPCGHSKLDACHKASAKLTCPEPCPLKLDCGHECGGKCRAKCPPCKTTVTKELPCGHSALVPCHRRLDPSESFRCDKDVQKTWPGCEHSVTVPCHTDETKTACPKPCDVVLPGCGHVCKGSCGECRNGRFHVRCGEKCGRALICGHECEEQCSEGRGCGPCKIQCQDEATGETRAEQRQCWEPCERPRCSEPCGKVLLCTLTKGCRFVCRGVCEPNEDCINICPKCQPKEWEEVTTTFFGPEDEADTLFVRLKDCGHVLPVQSVDQWVDLQLAGEEDKPREVTVLPCPKCKTPIRKSLRYGPAIKAQLKDIEAIKRKQIGDPKEIENTKESVVAETLELAKEAVGTGAEATARRLAEAAASLRRERLSSRALVRLRCAAQLTQQLLRLHLKVLGEPQLTQSRIPYTESNKAAASLLMEALLFKRLTSTQISATGFWENSIRNWLNYQMDKLWKWLGEKWEEMTEREMNGAEAEVYRLQLALPFFLLLKKLLADQRELRERHKRELMGVRADLHGPRALDEALGAEVSGRLGRLGRELGGGAGVSAEERRQILKAFAGEMGKGHWFKCPNGHLYVIGECGGAMEEAKCNECGAQIGGRQHRVRRDNAFAPEFDGANNAAWPMGHA